VWNFYEFRRDLMRPAEPNPAHYALTDLEKRFSKFTLITQNIDDLHQRAGSQNVVRLHGRINENKCLNNCQGDPTLIDVSTLEWERDAGPPSCPYCGAKVRPNVVWFGENLPSDTLQLAGQVSAEAHVMIVVGT